MNEPVPLLMERLAETRFDNSDEALATDRQLLAAWLASVAPSLEIVSTQADDATAAFFVLSTEALQHEAALRAALQTLSPRYELVARRAALPLPHAPDRPPWPVQPMRETLAIRRQSYLLEDAAPPRRYSRWSVARGLLWLTLIYAGYWLVRLVSRFLVF